LIISSTIQMKGKANKNASTNKNPEDHNSKRLTEEEIKNLQIYKEEQEEKKKEDYYKHYLFKIASKLERDTERRSIQREKRLERTKKSIEEAVEFWKSRDFDRKFYEVDFQDFYRQVPIEIKNTSVERSIQLWFNPSGGPPDYIPDASSWRVLKDLEREEQERVSEKRNKTRKQIKHWDRRAGKHRQAEKSQRNRKQGRRDRSA